MVWTLGSWLFFLLQCGVYFYTSHLDVGWLLAWLELQVGLVLAVLAPLFVFLPGNFSQAFSGVLACMPSWLFNVIPHISLLH